MLWVFFISFEPESTVHFVPSPQRTAVSCRFPSWVSVLVILFCFLKIPRACSSRRRRCSLAVPLFKSDLSSGQSAPSGNLRLGHVSLRVSNRPQEAPGGQALAGPARWPECGFSNKRRVRPAANGGTVNIPEERNPCLQLLGQLPPDGAPSEQFLIWGYLIALCWGEGVIMQEIAPFMRSRVEEWFGV